MDNFLNFTKKYNISYENQFFKNILNNWIFLQYFETSIILPLSASFFLMIITLYLECPKYDSIKTSNVTYLIFFELILYLLKIYIYVLNASNFAR